MASNIRLIASFYILLHICSMFSVSHADMPDLGDFQSMGSYVINSLITYLNDATGFEMIQKFYEDEITNIELKDVKADLLVNKMAVDLGKLLKRKVAALKKSVTWAEEKAEAYKWSDKIAEVDYVNSKAINTSSPGYEYSEQYGQYVNFENSSVHIPVEIYNGTIDILNGLAWTSDLEEQWKLNKEEDPDLLWQFFGSQSGIMRNYPSSAWLQEPWMESTIDLYDVRRRPWYTQGISSPKDMLILVDTSGSTKGQALEMMRFAAVSLLDTLGEADFVNVVHFAAAPEPVVKCFDTFVQANHWNKEILRHFINELKAEFMASYIKAFEYAFKEFNELDNRTDEVGAKCNKIIMFLTDGGSEMPEEVFQKYNGNQSVRIFTYAVGPTASPIEAVRWIACQNKGFFYKIPAMGAIRSTVQNYYKFLTYGLAESQVQEDTWTHIYADTLGLGMMTTVTMPVYNRTLGASNQTILGVMGTDVTIADMEQFTRTKQLGPNGYVMAINTNGYILMHPDLTAQYAWVSDPVNVDFLDIEYSTPEKEELRRHMIDGETGFANITAPVYISDKRHIDNSSRLYYYTNIPNSTFSLAVVIPETAQLYFAGRLQDIPLSRGLDSLRREESSVLVAPWDYCPGFELPDNDTLFDEFVDELLLNHTNCDMTLLQHLFTDVNVTEQMETHWETTYNSDDNGVYAFITSTNSGMTRIYPANASELMENFRDPWQAAYYKRSFDYPHWIYTAMGATGNSSVPLILASRAVNITIGSNTYIPAVIGAWVEQEILREQMFKRVDNCEQTDIYSCYFVDDGGYLIASNTDDDSHLVGMFFGDEKVEPVLMNKLVNLTAYVENIQYDYQAACPVENEQPSAAPSLRSFIPTLLFDVMSISWWTSKLTWTWLNFEIVQWLFASPQYYSVYGTTQEQYNVSCVKRQKQFTINTDWEKSDQKDESLTCGNCTRKFMTTKLKESNLMFVMISKDCGGDCKTPLLLQNPVKVKDPNLQAAEVYQEDDSHPCTVVQRYRKRPSCYDSNPNEDTSACSGGGAIYWSFSVLILILLAGHAMTDSGSQ